MQKILVKGPALSRSGYGEQTRFALRALSSRPDLFKIYILNIPWGRTGQIAGDDEFRRWIDTTVIETAQYVQQKGVFDLSLQVTIPPEFEKIAPINIGYTAGIETTKVAPQWLVQSNQMVNKIITISEHSRGVFNATKYDLTDDAGNAHPNYGLNIPVEAVGYPVRRVTPEDVNIEFVTDNNFLVVSQWGPRKNLDNTIKWFVEEFREDETAGLVLKTNTISDSIIDRHHTTTRLKRLLNMCGDYKCKVYFIHGELTEEELAWLYSHPTMKALINIAHGEGFGLPLFEAAYNGLPVVTITWGGQLDFLCKPNKKNKRVPHVIKVDYTLAPVQPDQVWEGVIEKDSMWAYAKEASYKRALREAVDKQTHYRQRATALQKEILENYTEEKLYEKFVSYVYEEPDADVLEWLNKIEEMESL